MGCPPICVDRIPNNVDTLCQKGVDMNRSEFLKIPTDFMYVEYHFIVLY
ncbi:hypothetical protein [Granulicatella sp. WM01]|nr:hypothetical protein [Granulicatella sp. WM01]